MSNAPKSIDRSACLMEDHEEGTIGNVNNRKINRPIWNFHTGKPNPQRFCDVEAEEGKARLILKNHKEFREIPWEDIKYQVEEAIKESK